MNATISEPRESIGATRSHRVFRVLLILLVSLLYLATMAPDVMTDDSAEFQVHCPLVQPTHPPGYPLLLLMGKIWSQLPLGTVAWRLSLMSVVFGIAAVVLLFELLALLLRSVWVAFATGLVFAVSHTFWMQSLMPEAYSLNAAFHALLLYLLARYECRPSERGALAGAVAFLLALATGNHQVIVLMAPVYALWMWWHSERGFVTLRRGVGAAVAFGLGASIYLVLTVRMRSLPASLDLALGGPSRGLLFVFGPIQLLKRLALCVGYHGYQFPLIAGVVGIGGWLWAFRRRRSWWTLTTALWLITVGYALNFDSSDVYVFYVPAYIAFAVWVGFGFDALYRSLGSRPLSAASWMMVAAVFLPPVFYWQTCRVLEQKGQIALSRDKGIRYYLFPPKDRADWFALRMRHLLKTAAPEGAILTDWNYYNTGRYLREIERWRPDVAVLDVTPGGPGDSRPADALASLSRHGTVHFYFPDEEIARSAAGTVLPSLLHTVGWHVGRDPYVSIREARRRLQAGRGEVARAPIPSIWDEIDAWIGRGRPAGGVEDFGTIEGRAFLTENVAVCRQKIPPVHFTVESSRLARGQGVWMAVENVRGLLPYDGWVTSGPVHPDRVAKGKRAGVQFSCIRLNADGNAVPGAAVFHLRRPLHNHEGRYLSQAVVFAFDFPERGGVGTSSPPGQGFFLDNSFYQYMIVPTEVPRGDYAVFLALTGDLQPPPGSIRGIAAAWRSRPILVSRITVE